MDRGSTDKTKDSVESDPGDRGDDRLKCFVPMAHSCASLCTLASRSQTGFSKKHTLTSSDSQCDHTGHSKRRVSLLRVLGSRADFCAANAPSLPYSSCYPGYDHCMGSWERIPAKDLPAQAGTCDWLLSVAWCSVHLHSTELSLVPLCKEYSRGYQKEQLLHGVAMAMQKPYTRYSNGLVRSWALSGGTREKKWIDILGLNSILQCCQVWG